MASNKLTPKQDLFCQEYIIDHNGVEAYLRAGYKAKNKNVAAVQANRMLSKPNIAKKINDLKEKREEKLKISAEWVLNEAVELYRMAKGEKAQIVSKVINNKIGKVEIYKTNLREANKALETIGKHTSVKAFEKELDLGDDVKITVIAPAGFED